VKAKSRLDLALVERGLAESRAKAQALILAGVVVVNEQRVDKPGTQVADDAEIRLKGEVLPYVSRGGLKLKHALQTFGISPAGGTWADIGASTGGFTDCLLQEGAVRVYAVDVGYGQLHEKMRQDPRVISRERINARYLTEADVPELVDGMTFDVSFISLTQVLPAALQRLKSGGQLVALVKPQFEVGRGKVGKGGVVRDAEVRAEAIASVEHFAREQGLELIGVTDSPIPGPAGNREALLGARRR
jgi:23S rRNA (cytidine1920-2'-O)/16S rRNA (cytidine1409-2'-O)-methyltransferase